MSNGLTSNEPSADGRASVAPFARCATHTNAPATTTCGRCGNYLCVACAIPSSFNRSTYCKDCMLRLEASGAGGVIPWENTATPFFTRYWRTVYEVLTRPTRFFERMPATGYLPAITFQYNSMVYSVALGMLVGWLMLRTTFGALRLPSSVQSQALVNMIVMLIAAAAITPIIQFISAGWMHLHASLFGARRGFAATYRATSYLHSVTFVVFAIEGIVFALGSQGATLVLLIPLAIYLLVITSIAIGRAHRMNGAAAFFSVLLVVAEFLLLWLFVLVPFMKSQGARIPV